MGCCKSTQYGCCIAIDHDESVILNKPTGKEIRHGPGWFCFPIWWDAGVIKSIVLQNNQYIIVRHITSPGNSAASHTSDIPLEKRVKSNENDQLIADHDVNLVEIIRGPQIYRLQNPYDRVSEIKPMLDLSSTQYMIITDKLSGGKRVESGPQLFCPHPYDEVGPIKSMYNLTSTEYIIVVDESTGEKVTVTGSFSTTKEKMNFI